MLPKSIYRSTAIPIKIPMASFRELQPIIPKFVWNHNSPQIGKAITRKKNKGGGIMLPDFKQSYKDVVI